MAPSETQDSDRMEQLILEAVREIFRHESFERFIAWSRGSIPPTLGLDDELATEEEQRLAGVLGLAIWNATPLPSQGYRPCPIEPASPEVPCPCGSGLRFGDCCGPAGDLPEVPTELIWELILDELPEAELQEALRRNAIPDELLAKVADRWLDAARPGRAAALLEPIFAGNLQDLDARYEPALDTLCDAYDQLEHWKKRQAFLQRITDDGSRPLKAAAWQRLSTSFIDEGELALATAAFGQAQRHGPDSPGTALLEITLLAAQHRDEHARARALFWRHRLRRAGYDGERIMDFLDRAIVDPQEALVVTHSAALDPQLVALREWVDRLDARPVTSYRGQMIDEPPISAPDGQLSLFTEEQLPLPPDATPRGRAAALRPPPALSRVEQAWHRVFQASKPYSTQLSALDDGLAWESAGWPRFLNDHLEAGDSLDVLDDLATALYDHPESSLPWVSHTLLRPLLERAEAIVAHTLEGARPIHLPWSDERNRPALRLLFRRYLQHAEEGEHEAAAAVLERLLSLNPKDNHGVRAELMNHYLRSDRDEQALDLARRFPADVLADLAYGEVLALYRLGQQERAAQVLNEVVGRLPRIPRFLMRKRVKRPTLSPDGFTPGGDDQAWLYREAMRDVWEAEPGLLAWMKRLTA